MKAGVFRGPGRFAIEEVAEPACPPGGLLLAIRACAVCGTDVRIVGAGHHKIVPPQVLGHELVGDIVVSDSPGHAPGQRVTVAPALGCGACRFCRAGHTNRCLGLRTIGYQFPGAFAERMPVPSEAVAQGHVLPVPDGLGDDVAALCEPLACCINGQELASVGAGDVVVIVGAGPIGCLHALVARAAGSGRVLFVEVRVERRARVERLGLGESLDPDQDLAAQIRDASDGAGADAVIVAAPSAAAQAAALGWLAPGGRLSLFGGLPPGGSDVTFDANLVHYPETMIVGAHGSTAAQNRRALELIAGAFRPVAECMVTDRFPLQQAAAAVAAARAGAGLKCVVEVG